MFGVTDHTTIWTIKSVWSLPVLSCWSTKLFFIRMPNRSTFSFGYGRNWKKNDFQSASNLSGTFLNHRVYKSLVLVLAISPCNHYCFSVTSDCISVLTVQGRSRLWTSAQLESPYMTSYILMRHYLAHLGDRALRKKVENHPNLHRVRINK